MSSNTKKIQELLDEQQAILNSIKSEAQELDGDKLATENEELTLELTRTREILDTLEGENEELRKELGKTKSALFSKLTQEKLYVFDRKQRELEMIYYREGKGLESRLNSYWSNCLEALNNTISSIEGYSSAELNDIISRLNELRAEAVRRKQELDARATAQLGETRRTNNINGEQLRGEPLTELEKNTAQKQKSLEAFVGLNVLGKAGILLFIVGIIMLGRFAYVHMTDSLKGMFIYLLAGVLIGVGELFHKKEKTVFSTTLISGGVATLYAACTTSYFAFELYSIKTAFVLCMLITAIAILLSKQIKSQVVCAFAAVGGYLPVVALYMMGLGSAAADKTFMPVSSVYFCVLASVIFLMSHNKKWYASQFIGYALHLISLGGIVSCALSLKSMAGYGYAIPLAIAYAVASFVIYLLMPATKIIRGKAIAAADTVLLTINTISGAVSLFEIIMNGVSNENTAKHIMGAIFLVFTVIYVVLMFFSTKEKKKTSIAATVVTSVSALIFSMLVVPYLFGIEYASIAWALEGLVLALISIEKKIKLPEIAGLLCMLLAGGYAIYNSVDDFSVLTVITLSVAVSCFWIYTVRGLIAVKANEAKPFIYYTTELLISFASAGYIYYLYSCIMKLPSINVFSSFTSACVAITATLLALVILRLGIFKNNISVAFSDIGSMLLMVVSFICIDVLFIYNDTVNIFYNHVDAKGLWIANVIMLVAINIAVELLFAFSVFDLVKRLEAPVWVLTIAISVSILAIITTALIVQFRLAFTSVILSAVYIFVACVLLFVGFKKNHTVVRSGGLVLILFAIAKLCFADTRGLDSAWKIASYFAFGALLILISFFYQKFTKKLEK